MMGMICVDCGGKITLSDDGPAYLLKCSRCGAVISERQPEDDRHMRHTDLVDLMSDTQPARPDYQRCGASLADIDSYTRLCLTKKCSVNYKSVV